MNKVGMLLAILVWVVVFAVIGFSYIFGNKEDPRDLLKNLSAIAQQYVNDTPVNLATVSGDGPGYQYIRIVGARLKVKQDIETRSNAETKSLMTTISVDNISNPTALEQSLQRVEAYIKLAETSDAEYKQAIEQMNQGLRALPKDASIFDPEATIQDSAALIATEEAQTKMRISLGQYVKAALEFVKSRTGYYTIEEKFIVFKIPEDQSYYDQIIAQTNTINRGLTDMIAQERAAFREDVSKIQF